jgi:hypothetical protein
LILDQSLRSRYIFRKTGATAPSLGLAQSFWALGKREILLAQSLEEACADGFEYFEVGLLEDRLSETASLLKAFPLKLIAQGWAATAGEARVFLERAVERGAVAINIHLGHAYLTADEAALMVDDVYRMADECRLPLLLETHRGRVTQDLLRTVKLRPDTVLTLDLSHYLVAGETLGGSEDLFRASLSSLLARTGLIHGRISNGRSIQVGTDDAFAFTEVLESLWQEAMELWLADAPADAVFVFEPELGPPPYVYTERSGSEIFSRTEETRVITELARRAWSAAWARHQLLHQVSLS